MLESIVYTATFIWGLSIVLYTYDIYNLFIWVHQEKKTDNKNNDSKP